MKTGALLLLATLAAVEGDPTTRVSERSFLDAVSRDQRVRAVLDEPVAIARADRARAGTWSNPEAGFEREAPSGQPRQDTWTLSWTPPLDGRPWVQGRAAREGLRAAESRREMSRMTLRAELREAFAAWALAHEGARLGDRLAALVDRLSRQAEVRASRGEASLLSARRLLLARVEVRAEAARLDADLARSAARIRAWMPELAEEAVPSRPPLPPVPTDRALWSRSPRIAALEHDLQQAEALSRLASRFWTLPELSIGHQRQRGDLADFEGPGFGVRWGLPLFDRRQGDRIEAHGRSAAARALRELETARVREEFAAALEAYSTLRESAALSLETESVAERVVESATEMFEAGESDVTDLLETLRGVLGGRLAALESYGAALRAHRELELAAGSPLPLAEGGE